MNIELIIDNNGRLQMPAATEGITWTTERKGTPGKLSFTVIKDELLDFQEGNHVCFSANGVNLFYGFVFTKKRGREQHISVTAYDQLRYLTNKETMSYKNKTASDVIRMIADDFNLELGEIAETSYRIEKRDEDNTPLFDIIYNALDSEITNKKQLFVLYDDFGKLTLKSIDQMQTDFGIDAETAENFDYTSTIDDQTYNRVKLSRNNENTGKRDTYVVQDGAHINDWGVLQYSDTLKEGENGDAKASALLDLYNTKTRKLKISKAFGDLRVRAGSLIIVKLALGDVNLSNRMLVEKCTHTFNNSEHFMDLSLRGGSFVG
jgi:hypothetical protein